MNENRRSRYRRGDALNCMRNLVRFPAVFTLEISATFFMLDSDTVDYAKSQISSISQGVYRWLNEQVKRVMMDACARALISSASSGMPGVRGDVLSNKRSPVRRRSRARIAGRYACNAMASVQCARRTPVVCVRVCVRVCIRVCGRVCVRVCALLRV